MSFCSAGDDSDEDFLDDEDCDDHLSESGNALPSGVSKLRLLPPTKQSSSSNFNSSSTVVVE